MGSAERLCQHTHRLPSLAVGDTVHIHDQIGNHHIKLGKTNCVNLTNTLLRVDGAGRATPSIVSSYAIQLS